MFGGGGWLVFSQPCEDEARNAIAQSSGRAGRRKSRVSVVGKKARGAMNRARATDRSGRVEVGAFVELGQVVLGRGVGGESRDVEKTVGGLTGREEMVCLFRRGARGLNKSGRRRDGED